MDIDYEALYRQLLPLARVVAPRGVDGADLVQEALTRALARHPDLHGVHDPAAYLSAAVVNGWCTSPVTVHLPGGDLLVEVDGAGAARLTGPVQEICRVEVV